MLIGLGDDNMKKIALLIGLMVMFSFMVLADDGSPPVPEPVIFTVNINGHNANYDYTVVENLATGEILTPTEVSSLKITNGIGGFDLSNFKQGYTGAVSRFGYLGDEIKVTICDVSPDCTFTFYAAYTTPDKFRFDVVITGVDYVPPEPEECPVCPTCVICPECPTQEECPEPEPYDILQILLGVGIAAILGIAGYLGKKAFTKEEQKSFETEMAKQLSVGSGFRMFKSWDGIVRTKHLHKGIKGYHDPQVNHKKPIHEPGKIIV